MISKLKSKFPGSVRKGSDELIVNRIKSGVFVFDLLTGGGLPEGRLSLLWGDYSTCKTTLSFKCINSYLKSNPDNKAVIVDFEHTYDKSWAELFVEDIERLVVIEPEFAEQGIDIVQEVLKDSSIGLVVVDSLAAMIPVTEANEVTGTAFAGARARLINILLNKLLVITAQRKKEKKSLTVILISHPNVIVGARTFGPQSDVVASKKTKLLCSLIVRTYRKAYKSIDGITTQGVYTITIQKNKLGLPNLSGEFQMYLKQVGNFGVGYVNNASTIVSYARKIGLLTKVKGGIEFCGRKFKSLTSLTQMLEDDPDFCEQAANELINTEIVFEDDSKEGEKNDI